MSDSDYQMAFNFNPALFRIILKFLKPQKGEKILDIGCNRGFYVKEMGHYTQDVMGIDNRKGPIENAVVSRIEYGDATDLNFRENTFDKIYSLHTIEHVPDTRKFLLEVARVLKPEGICVLIYPWEPILGIQAVWAAMRRYKNPLMAKKIHLHRLTPKKIKELTKGTSLTALEGKFIFASGLHYLSVLKKSNDNRSVGEGA